jgi:hypothetical protein
MLAMAENAGSIQSSDELRKLIKYQQKEHDRVATSPTSVIEKFTQAQLLKHIYFLLSQSSHPISAYQQYIELDSTGEHRRIRRNALNQDMSYVTGFLFQILSIALLTDASLSRDKAFEDSIFNIALDTFSINQVDLTLSSTK